ncbi:zinc-finger domain-containing protein [Heyndrickxia sp. NPDC080065]|uniref:zinc-finger domain-containing protein n=1 Tax=Heyndrickxia sp. NPDC080065 TaxID=3390568 RepID=UPI003D085E11
MERKLILEEMNAILTAYCDGCLVKSSLRKEFSKTYAHQFCIQKCTVGEQLRKFGNQLELKKI